MKAAVVGCLMLASVVGCGSTSRRGPGVGDQTGGAGGAGAVDETASCSRPPAVLVRLSFPELVDSVGGLLGDEVRDDLAAELMLDEDNRAFPPLEAPDEGPRVDDARFERSDRLAQWLGRYVRDNFASVTGCDADHDCVRDFVADLGDRAFRRPLSSAEEQALLLMVDRAEALGVAPQYALEYGVQAVFSSPHFLYRSELGAPEEAGEELRLTDHEVASALSFFATGRAPDDTLRAAADAGELGSPKQLRAQLQRLLGEPLGRRHLERMVQSYFRVPRLQTLVLDPAVYPTWSRALASSMRVELEALLAMAVTGTSTVGSLLTTRKARADATLSAHYGLEFPPPGAQLDAQGFAEIELPESRAGLLTRAGWSALHSRPDGPDVISRGLAVRALMLCDYRGFVEHPPIDVMPASSGAQRARARLADEACRDCHAGIDAFGLALEDLDGVGLFRTRDSDGSPIDASATLPDELGGAQVRGAMELSHALSGEAFAGCLAQGLLGYALGSSSPAQQGESCRQELTGGGDATLPELVERVVQSPMFAVRKR